MLRVLAAVLLVVNLVFFAWSRGWLGPIAHPDREPDRLARQVHPELVRVLPATLPAASAGAASGAGTVLACLQAGPFSPADAAIAEAALRTAVPDLASRGFSNVASEQPGVWAVYMGKFSNTEQQERKEAELARRRLDFERLEPGDALGPALVLSRHDSLPSANEALTQLGRQGIHTAKVVALSPPGVSHLMRVEKADAATQTRLSALDEPAFASHRFERCEASAAPR